MEIKSVFDIPVGAVITCVNGERYINLGKAEMVKGIIFHSRPSEIVALGDDGYITFRDNDLTRNNVYNFNEAFCIDKIEKYCPGRGVNVLLGVKPVPTIWNESDIQLLWQHEEPIEEMTLEEICEALGKNIKIVKR